MSCLVITLLSLFWGYTAAGSVLCGCTVFAVPTLYFTHYAFKYPKGVHASLVARAFYWGQAGKLSLMAMGFALVFVFAKPPVVTALFIGFCLMIPAHLLVAMFVSKNYGDSPH